MRQWAISLLQWVQLVYWVYATIFLTAVVSCDQRPLVVNILQSLFPKYPLVIIITGIFQSSFPPLHSGYITVIFFWNSLSLYSASSLACSKFFSKFDVVLFCTFHNSFFFGSVLILDINFISFNLVMSFCSQRTWTYFQTWMHVLSIVVIWLFCSYMLFKHVLVFQFKFSILGRIWVSLIQCCVLYVRLYVFESKFSILVWNLQPVLQSFMLHALTSPFLILDMVFFLRISLNIQK